MSELVLEQAQETINKIWRPDRGLPTSPSHPDTFMANLDGYIDAHLAMDNLDRAIDEFDMWKESRFPSGFTPHYMLGPHKRAGIETKWVDAIVQKTIRLKNGERVTSLAGPPNWAIAASSIAEYLEANGEPEKAQRFVDLNFDYLVESSQALYDARGTKYGFIVQIHRDELTIRDGSLSRTTIQPVNEPSVTESVDEAPSAEDAKRIERNQSLSVRLLDEGINGMLVQNNFALRRLAEKYGKSIPKELIDNIENTDNHVVPGVASITPTEADVILGVVRGFVGRQENPSTPPMLTQLEKFIAEKGESEFGPFEDDSLPKDKLKIRPDLNLRICRIVLEMRKGKIDPNGSTFQKIGNNVLSLLGGSSGFSRIIDFQSTRPVVGRTAVSRRAGGSQELWTPTVTEVINFSATTK